MNIPQHITLTRRLDESSEEHFNRMKAEIAAGKTVWSGKGEPPAIGTEATCNDRPKTLVHITGYVTDGGWLMAEGYRVADPSNTGTLTGSEILYP